MAFLVFEGLDGSGKTSLIRRVGDELSRRGQRFIGTREPGGTPLGEELRQVLLRTNGEVPVPECELLLYEAIRAQHVARVIKPALDSGNWVLCDRFTASTVAFQVGGRGLDPKAINWLNDYATLRVQPTAFILVDVPVQVGAARQEKRHQETGTAKDRFEREQSDFYERVRLSYIQQAKENSDHWIVLDGTQDPQKVGDQFISELTHRGILR